MVYLKWRGAFSVSGQGSFLRPKLEEASTTEIAVQKDAQGFRQNKKAAQEGGEISGNARRELERKSGRKVVSKSNFLDTNTSEIELISEK
jgi:hypothetical protein